VTAEAIACGGCATPLTLGALACTKCRTLVHKEELKSLSARASEATARGDLSAALEAWRVALDLLPRESGQYAKVHQKVADLSTKLDEKPANPRGKLAAGAGAIGLLLWKVKGLALWLFAIGKPLLLGLTKLPTLLSMALSVAVYWAAFGAKFAVGLIACIYVHEIGHVVALRRYGIAASAPMFIPGFGAVVRLKQYPIDAREDANVGLAGPRWGLGASCAAITLGFLLHAPSLIAIGRVSAIINLFNLMPLGSLDGGRGFRALDKRGRQIATAAIAVAWMATGESMLVLLLIVAVFRLLGEAPERGDRPALIEYVLLVAMLAALTMVHVPGVATPR
jgi:Zn-dependent protease